MDSYTAFPFNQYCVFYGGNYWFLGPDQNRYGHILLPGCTDYDNPVKFNPYTVCTYICL
jgi:hypothetical protein